MKITPEHRDYYMFMYFKGLIHGLILDHKVTEIPQPPLGINEELVGDLFERGIQIGHALVFNCRRN